MIINNISQFFSQLKTCLICKKELVTCVRYGYREEHFSYITKNENYICFKYGKERKLS